jgi:hypothetical protein
MVHHFIRVLDLPVSFINSAIAGFAPKAITALVEAGGNINTLLKSGNTTLQEVISRQDPDWSMVRVMRYLQLGANPNYGKFPKPLDMAQHSPFLTKQLLEHGATLYLNDHPTGNSELETSDAKVRQVIDHYMADLKVSLACLEQRTLPVITNLIRSFIIGSATKKRKRIE